MALGKQFEDTYWEDPSTGETKSWTRRGKDPARVPDRSPTTKTNAPDDELSGHQGILFHPATATGTKDDPLVPLERRETASNVALGLTDIDAYKSRVQRKANVKISDNMARTDADLLRDSLVNSETPIREIENTKVSAFLNPRRDRGGGFAETYSDTIMIGKQKRGKWETIPESKALKTTPSDRPIANPKFWDWYDKNINRDQEDASEGLLSHTEGTIKKYGYHTKEDGTRSHGQYGVPSNANIRWQHSRTGEVLENSDAIKKAEGNVENLRGLGFVPNLFPGKGKSSNKVHAGDTFDFTKGYSYTKDEATTSKMHSRFEPESVEEVTIPEKDKYTKTPHIDQGTLVHEIGHQRDEHMDDRYSHRNRFTKNYSRYGFADPLEEGFADGRRDRYATALHGGMGDMYEDVLHDPSDPTRSMKRGYGVDHAQWKNKTHKALYVASRVAARTGDNGRDQYPSREGLADSLDMPLTTGRSDTRYGVRDPENKDHAEAVSAMALGQMLTTTPSLMKHLKGQGLHDVGKQARAAYIDARRNRSREQNGGWTQPQLPGMED
jgi:hypothetical protein